MRSNTLPTLVIANVFLISSAVVTIGLFYPTEGAQTILQLIILAGLVVGFLDRHYRQQEVTQKLDDNTRLTAKTEEKINGRLEALVEETRKASYAQGMIDAQAFATIPRVMTTERDPG